MDENFAEALQTHLQRLTNSAQQDTEFLVGLAYLAQASSDFVPIYNRFMTINSNQLEAIMDIAKDLAELSKFTLQLLLLLKDASPVTPPHQDN